eukprot:6134812-Lingulodinium_polyedra.AAC.1
MTSQLELDMGADLGLNESWETEALQTWQHSFILHPMIFASLVDLQPFLHGSIAVLMSSIYICHQLVSDASWQSLDYVLEAFQSKVSKSQAEPGGPSRKTKKDHISENPWIQHFLEEQHQLERKVMVSSSSSKDVTLPLDEQDMQEDTIDQEAVFDLLYKKRAELAMSAPAIVSDFSVVLLGGKWTQQHRQRPYDYVMGKASGSTVESWCVQWGFQKSM